MMMIVQIVPQKIFNGGYSCPQFTALLLKVDFDPSILFPTLNLNW